MSKKRDLVFAWVPMLDGEGTPITEFVTEGEGEDEEEVERDKWEKGMFEILHWATETNLMEEANVGKYVNYETVIYARDTMSDKIQKLDPLACDLAFRIDSEWLLHLLEEMRKDGVLTEEIKVWLRNRAKS